MDRVVLFLKTFSRDLERLKILIESIRCHNRDALKTYVIIPAAERRLFEDTVGKADLNYLSEEDFASASKNPHGWLKQQLIKYDFHKMGLAAHYVVLDSDDTIIRDFHVSDFIASDNRPYFVMSEAKERSRMALTSLRADPAFTTMFWQVRAHKEKIQKSIGRAGKIQYFQPAPIFITALLQEFDRQVLAKSKITFDKLLAASPFEADWIGEWIAKFKLQSVHPCEPFFLELQREELIALEKRLGVTLADLGQWYLGIRLCAGWNSKMIWS